MHCNYIAIAIAIKHRCNWQGHDQRQGKALIALSVQVQAGGWVQVPNAGVGVGARRRR